MKESHMRTKLAHTGDLELAKKIQSSVSVPKVLPIYMSSVFTFDDVPLWMLFMQERPMAMCTPE